MTACPACTTPEGYVIPEHPLDFCNAHMTRWLRWRQETQPPVRRRRHPRCLVCRHRPRLLRALWHLDAWECRWGHIVTGEALARAGWHG